MSEYTNGCADCQAKLKKELKDIAGELSDAIYETSSETSQAFCIGTAYGKLLCIIDKIPDKEDDETK